MRHKHTCVLTLVVCGGFQANAQITLNSVPERAIGTPALQVTSFGPNLVDGREFYAPQAVALDTSVTPPILYVSDYVNNRVLAWKNATGFTRGQMADLAIGQPDLKTTFPEGPSIATSTYSTGLTRPSGLAVDTNGNLYVVDGGNNRILRYPKPFAQTGQFPIPNLEIGQANLAGHAPNYPTGTATPTAQGIFLSNGNGTGSVLASSLAFDGSGNLWVVDTGNARILRFEAADLAGTGGALTADLELGQLDLVSKQTGLNTSNQTSYYKLNQFISPTAIGFDPSGNLFAADYNRVLVFTPPFSSGMSASSHILGIFPLSSASNPSQATIDNTAVFGPTGFFFLTGSGNSVGVVDAAWNRIMIYDSFANWPTDGTPPQAKSIIGQPNATCSSTTSGTCKSPNNGSLTGPSAGTLYQPAGAAYSGTNVYVADAGNNRVLEFPQQGSTIGTTAINVLGQDYFNTNSPNLIEGREFQFSGTINGSTFADAGMVVDAYSGTPHLYVADPYNNRVLGFKDLRKFQNGAANKADIVLGQADFTTALINYPSGDPNKPTKSGLHRPIGLLVDSQGNLYVADSFNSRVLRFPAPFAYTGTAPEPADLVLGQQDFTSKVADPSSSAMAIPYGLAFTPSCNILSQPCPAPNGLLVSDQGFNRVTYYPTTNGTFAAGTDNGKAATIVFGQSSFSAIGAGSGLAQMSNPHHISCDTNGYLYVADTGNNRVLIYPDPHGPGTPATGEAASANIGGLNGPESVYASPVTGEIWVANAGAGTTLRYANYQSVLLGLGSITGLQDISNGFQYHPVAAIQDQYGDLFIADDAHRVTFYYPGLNVVNSANFVSISSHALAPLAIGSLFPCGNCSGTQFVAPYTVFSGYPVPPVLSDIQVLIDGTPAPLYFVSGGQINFIVPNSARTSGFADLQVIQYSTGQILGAAQVPMYSVAPGAFEYPGGQTGATIYAAAINQDTTINSASNPAPKGSVISLYMTGSGNVPGAPPDGQPATAALSAPVAITVLLNGVDVNSPTYQESDIQHIQYSGINVYPGMWQINVLIPKTVVTTSPVWFAVLANGVSNWDSASGFKTYIYVK